MLVDQREIQARGGKCARYPVSCLIGELLARAGVIKPLRRFKVLDLTFGEGRFWAALPNAEVWGFDIRRLRWVVKPSRFYNESCEGWRKHEEILSQSFDVVVADPPFSPYQRGWEKRGHYRDNGSIPIILYEARKAAIHFRAPLLIHFVGKLVFYGFRVMAEAWFLGISHLTQMSFPTWFGVLSPEVGEG